MGIFDFLKPKEKPSPELGDAMKKISAIAFPGGQQQIAEETGQLHALLKGHISRDEAGRLLTRTKALLVISEDKSEPRIASSILRSMDGKLNQQEARLVYMFLTGVTGPSTSGGDGSSAEQAIVINATSSVVGINAEYEWIERTFGPRNSAWQLESQMVTAAGSRRFDVMTVRLAGGETKTLYFDVTSFYGRF